MAPRGPKEAPRRPQEAPRWPQDGSKTRQDRPKTAPRRPQDDPNPHESPKEPPRGPGGPQEASKTPPRSCKSLPRDPKRPILIIKTSISCGRCCIFARTRLQSCVQYVAVRPPPGPRSAGLNPAAGLVPASCVRSRRTYSAAVIRVIGEFPFPGHAHSAGPDA